jgi:hypothetical protein
VTDALTLPVSSTATPPFQVDTVRLTGVSVTVMPPNAGSSAP